MTSLASVILGHSIQLYQEFSSPFSDGSASLLYSLYLDKVHVLEGVVLGEKRRRGRCRRPRRLFFIRE